MDSKEGHSNTKKNIINVVLLFGVISCFGDVIYEGARSANGQYFELLAVNAASLGTLYGVGEFLGYALRLVSGKISDKTGRPWPLIFLGYGSLIVVPFMGMTKNLTVLFTLFLIERIGKALRNPPKDTVLSQIAEKSIGTGLVFGIQEALDQLGAFIGPLVFTLTFTRLNSRDLATYQTGYRLLFPFYILLMIAVFTAYRKITDHNLIQVGKTIRRENETLTKSYWLYTLFGFFASFGLVAYSIIGFHLKTKGIFPDEKITALYSLIMIVDAVMAIIIGKAYDTVKNRLGSKQGGIRVLAFVPFLTAIIPFLVFSVNKSSILLGMVLYGLLLGTHETIMRSAIADLSVYHKRGSAYGIFNAVYGASLFGGSALMGRLYDRGNIPAIRGISVLTEVLALVVFFFLVRELKRTEAR